MNRLFHQKDIKITSIKKNVVPNDRQSFLLYSIRYHERNDKHQHHSSITAITRNAIITNDGIKSDKKNPKPRRPY